MNLMAFNNGRIGINAEHSWADALVIAHLFETCIFIDASPDLGAGHDETGSCKPSDDEPVDPTLYFCLSRSSATSSRCCMCDIPCVPCARPPLSLPTSPIAWDVSTFPFRPPDPTDDYCLNRYIPQRLLWDIHEKSVLGKAITEAHDASREASSNTELVIMTFNKFGKGKIKKMQMSPDAVIQMALQLAFYRDQDRR